MRQAPPIQIQVGRPSEYQRAKNLLNVGRHPAFVGRNLIERCATNGGLIFFVIDGDDAAVAAINTRKGVLNVLNVHPAHRDRGVGDAALIYIKPNFVRAVESAVGWFERRGYVCIGEPKIGVRLTTRLMARSALFDLAGNLRQALE